MKKKQEKRTYLKNATEKMEWTDTVYIQLIHLGYKEIELDEIDDTFTLTSNFYNPISKSYEETYPFYINKDIKRFHLTDKSFY